jgi:hypothetical protein
MILVRVALQKKEKCVVIVLAVIAYVSLVNAQPILGVKFVPF